MGGRFRLACVQMTAGEEMAANIAAAGDLIRRARDGGADVIATPENTGFLASRSALAVQAARVEAEHPALAAFRDLAAETGAWLLIGSLGIRLADEARIANRSFLIAPTGAIAARYDKIHMFDVDLPSGESYRESRNFRPGDEAVVADLPWGRLGMSICYDLRFPQLYRALAQAGASLLAVPSAFTRITGAAHWHLLLRARAVETGCHVFAPAQCGTHSGGRQTFGHSLIVDPWGAVLADGGEAPGVVLAEIDTDRVAEVRRQIPSLDHDRAFSPPGQPVRAAE